MRNDEPQPGPPGFRNGYHIPKVGRYQPYASNERGQDGPVKAGPSREQRSTSSVNVNFMDLQSLLNPEEAVALPEPLTVRYIEPTWAQVKMREQLICHPGTSNIMSSLGSARIKDVVSIMNNQCTHLVHSLLVDLQIEKAMRYQLKVLENLNLTEGKTPVLHLGDIGHLLMHPKQKQIIPETAEEKIQFNEFRSRYNKLVEQLNDFPQVILLYLLSIAQINRFLVSQLNIFNIILKKVGDQAGNAEVTVCRDKKDPIWPLFLKGIGSGPSGEPTEVDGQLRLDDVLNLLHLSGEDRANVLCAVGMFTHYHFIQYQLLQGFIDDRKFQQDENGKNLTFCPNPVLTFQVWFPVVTIVGYQGNLSLFSEFPEDLITSGSEQLQDFRRHFSNKGVLVDLEVRLLSSFQLYLSELISSEKICLAARLRCVSVEEYNQNPRVFQYQQISSKLVNKNLSVYRNVLRDLAIMAKTSLTKTPVTLPPALTHSSEHLHLVSTNLIKHAEYKCLLDHIKSVGDDVSLLRKDIEDIKKTVDALYSTAVYGNTHNDVTSMKSNIERLTKHLLPEGTVTTNNLDPGMQSGADAVVDKADSKEDNAKKQLKLKLRCEKK